MISSKEIIPSIRSIVPLSCRLFVLLRMHHVLVLPDLVMGRLKCRSHLKYFASVLQRCNVDVTIATPFDFTSDTHGHFVDSFAKEFPCPFRHVHFPGRTFFQAPSVVERIVTESGGKLSRVLYIEGEVSQTYYRSNTIVVEACSQKVRLQGEERKKKYKTEEENSTSLAITQPDNLLLALTEIVKDMALNTEADVSYALKTEAMLELVKVPSIGEVFYLPMENCDHFEQMDVASMDVEVHNDINAPLERLSESVSRSEASFSALKLDKQMRRRTMMMRFLRRT